MPKLEDIRAALPPEGISIGEMIRKFRSQLHTAQSKKDFIGLVKQVGKTSPHDKNLIVQK